MNKRKIKLSRVSAIHYAKLVFRSLLLLVAAVLYFSRKSVDFLFEPDGVTRAVLAFIWLVFALEIVLRMFPSSLESMGCQKQFKRNYKPYPNAPTPINQTGIVTFSVFAAWVALNAIIGILYFADIIDKGALLLISLGYSVCDMICILFFCPFQTWFMKNRCCASCRIYNWDFAMMFTPLVFVPHLYTWSLLGLALVLLVIWEVCYKLHPERFSEYSNSCLSCANCNEKLCQHKKQLRVFLKKNKKRLVLKGNELLTDIKDRTKK